MRRTCCRLLRTRSSERDRKDCEGGGSGRLHQRIWQVGAGDQGVSRCGRRQGAVGGRHDDACAYLPRRLPSRPPSRRIRRHSPGASLATPRGGERTGVAREQPRGYDGRGGRGPGEESVLAVHVCGRGRVRRLARALAPFTAPRLPSKAFQPQSKWSSIFRVGDEFRTYRWGGEPTPNQRRVPVTEAADAQGISEGAVRMRVKRGTLPSTREGGRLYVLLNTEPTPEPGRPTSVPTIVPVSLSPRSGSSCRLSARPTPKPAGCWPQPWSGSRPSRSHRRPQKPPRRPRSSRVGASPTPLRGRLRRPCRSPGGVGC